MAMWETLKQSAVPGQGEPSSLTLIMFRGAVLARSSATPKWQPDFRRVDHDDPETCQSWHEHLVRQIGQSTITK